MSESKRTLSELHNRIVYLWKNKQYGQYMLETLENHIITIKDDGTLSLIHDNAFIESNFNPFNKEDSIRKFLQIYFQPCVYN